MDRFGPSLFPSSSISGAGEDVSYFFNSVVDGPDAVRDDDDGGSGDHDVDVAAAGLATR